MFTLIVGFYASMYAANEAVSLHSVPGFANKEVCEKAAALTIENLDNKLRVVVAYCVPLTDGPNAWPEIITRDGKRIKPTDVRPE